MTLQTILEGCETIWQHHQNVKRAFTLAIILLGTHPTSDPALCTRMFTAAWLVMGKELDIIYIPTTEQKVKKKLR